MLRLRAPRNAAIRPHSELISVSLTVCRLAVLFHYRNKLNSVSLTERSIWLGMTDNRNFYMIKYIRLPELFGELAVARA
jgi:hypothetical protein